MISGGDAVLSIISKKTTTSRPPRTIALTLNLDTVK
jgi:hypothetical protein